MSARPERVRSEDPNSLGPHGSEEMVTCFRRAADSMTYEDFRHCIHHEGTGAVRVSLGLASNLADVETFLRLAEDFLED
jgi:hypothetical protein